MMKWFCDNCGVEITPKNQFERAEVTVADQEIVVYVKERVEGEDYNPDSICLHCVIDAVKSLDDRPIAV